MKIGITGAQGLIGWHIRAFLRAHRPLVEVALATRATFSDRTTLQEFVQNCDAIIHCAGVNRGTNAQIEEGNIQLAQALANALETLRPFPHLVFTNSTHSRSDSIYGSSKRKAAEILENAAGAGGGNFTNLILPHVFGEFGRPFHNSVVATFCHQLAAHETPVIHNDGVLYLVHAQQVAAHIITTIDNHKHGTQEIEGRALHVSVLLAKLQAFQELYVTQQTIPSLADPLDLALFNMFRSYRFPAQAITPLTLRSDARGHLFEAVRTLHGGQAFLSTTHSGITRGNHFHTSKVERFLVCAGEAEIAIRKLFSDHVERFTVSGDSPCFIDMPSFHTHNITNIGAGELVTIFWAHELFDPANPDTFVEPV